MGVYEIHIKELTDEVVSERTEMFEGYWRDAQILGDKIAKNTANVREVLVKPKGVNQEIYHYWL